MKCVKSFALLAVSLILLSGLLVAQQATAKIIGIVQLEDGSLVPGVSVEATSPKLVGKTTAVTDENGAFRLFNLSPGTYKLVFSLQGFQTVIQENVLLAVEQTLNLKINMKLGNIDEAITIKGKVAQIDVKSTAKGMTLTKEVFQSLPKGRNFDSLVTTIPGVSTEPMIGGTSIDGATGLENMYYVDGANTTNLVRGNAGQNVSFDFVDEVQVKSSGYAAEFGGSLGGVINVVTRSGGNEFHGDVLGYYSGAALRAPYSDTLDIDKTNSKLAKYYTYEQYTGKDDNYRVEGGFNLGGYVIKDKLWFFGSFMPVYYANTRTVSYFPLGAVKKDWKQTQNTWNAQLKLTAQPVKNLRVSASVVNNFFKYKGNLSTASGNPNPSISYDNYGFNYPNLSGNLSLDLTMGNNFMVSLRGSYFGQNWNKPLVLPPGVQYMFQTEAPGGYFPTTNIGLLDVPATYQHPADWTSGPTTTARTNSLDEMFSVNADFSYFMNLGGEHNWKAGVQLVHQGQNYDAGAIYPIVRLGWDRNLIAYGKDYGRGKYGYYAVRANDATGPNGNVYKAYSDRWALYLQDSWTIANRLTLNLGIRTESEYIPSYSDNPKFVDAIPVKWGFADKLAPRFGFVWDVKGDSTLKVFGSVGKFYDVQKLRMASGSFGGEKWKSAYYYLDTYEFDKIGQPGWNYGTPLAVFDFRIPSFETTDPNMHAMSQIEMALGLEKKISDNVAFSARLVNKNLLWAIEDIGIMTPEGEAYYITNPGGDYIKEKWNEQKATGAIPQGAPDIPKAKRQYWGVNLALDKRFSDNWTGGINYTWSSLRGNYSGLASGDESGRSDPNVARYFDLWYLAFDKSMKAIDGPMAGDRPHYLKVYGSYSFPFGLTTGVVLNAMSGIPVSTEYAMDVQGYLPFGRGDMGRTPFFYLVNLYLEYNIKLGKNNLNINLNVDNLLNTRTAQRIYSIYNSGSVTIDYDTLIAANWNIDDFHPVLNPRFGKEYWFYGDGSTGLTGRGLPLSARLGFKFSF
jgi:hypothetical protein